MVTQSPQDKTWRKKRRFTVVAGCIVVLLGLMSALGVPGKLASWRGERLLKNHQLLAAEAWLGRAVEWGNESANTLFLRARVSRKLGIIEEFALRLKAASEKGLSRETTALEITLAEAQRGKIENLAEQLPKLLVSGKEPDEICEAFATACLMKYRLDDAAQILEVWKLDYPDDPRPDYFLGRIFEHRDNYEEAEKSYRSAIARNSGYSPAIFNLGRLLIVQQRPQEALPFFERCEQTLGAPEPGQIMQAQCHRLTGDLPSARRVAMQIDTKDQARLSLAFRAVGESSNGAIAGVFAEQGHIAMAEKNFTEAAAAFGRAIEINPFDWRVRYQLALAQRESGLTEIANENLKFVNESREAMAECDKLFDLLKTDPENPETRLRIGQIFLKYVSENQGLVWMSSALDYDPGHIKAHQELATYFQSHSRDNPEFARLAEMHSKMANQNSDKGDQQK